MSEANSIFVLVLSMLLFTVFAVFTILYIALQKKKQYRNYLEKQEMEHRFSSELMMSKLEVQEQTLKTLSVELHDNIAQLLGMAKMQASVLRDNAADDWKDLGADTVSMIGEAIQGVRDMSHVMNGTYILRAGLEDSIKKDIERIASATRIKCNFNSDGVPFILDEGRELILFRIIQEGVANAVKHAEPQSVTVSLSYTPQQVHVCIEDDGKGFDTTVTSKTGGIGLGNIGERTALLKGTVNIDSAPRKGTRVNLYIPS